MLFTRRSFEGFPIIRVVVVPKLGMSARRACRASGFARSTMYYRSVVRDESRVITLIRAFMAPNPHHGFGRIELQLTFAAMKFNSSSH